MNKLNPYKTNPLFERIEQERKHELICVSRETIEKALAKMLEHCNYISCWACPFWGESVDKCCFQEGNNFDFLAKKFHLEYTTAEEITKETRKSLLNAIYGKKA